jgi:hypothetical protein
MPSFCSLSDALEIAKYVQSPFMRRLWASRSIFTSLSPDTFDLAEWGHGILFVHAACRPTHSFAPKTKMPQTRFEPWGYPFGGSSPRSCPPLFRRHLGWRGCLESHISSGFSARCAPITGNRAPGHPSMRWVRRGVKPRFSFVAMLFVLYGSGLLAVVPATSLAG